MGARWFRARWSRQWRRVGGGLVFAEAPWPAKGERRSAGWDWEGLWEEGTRGWPVCEEEAFSVGLSSPCSRFTAWLPTRPAALQAVWHAAGADLYHELHGTRSFVCKLVGGSLPLQRGKGALKQFAALTFPWGLVRLPALVLGAPGVPPEQQGGRKGDWPAARPCCGSYPISGAVSPKPTARGTARGRCDAPDSRSSGRGSSPRPSPARARAHCAPCPPQGLLGGATRACAERARSWFGPKWWPGTCGDR